MWICNAARLLPHLVCCQLVIPSGGGQLTQQAREVALPGGLAFSMMSLHPGNMEVVFAPSMIVFSPTCQ